jgi:parallel beta-helix repeat protein
MKTYKICISVICVISGWIFATVINVPADQPSIQAGIDFAEDGDTVLVASGTYYENVIWPEVNGIKLIGEDRETTIIDGSQDGSVIRFEFDEENAIIDSTTEISNFTITNGFANGEEDYYTRIGGGLYLQNASPVMSGLTVISNDASYDGGGLYLSNSNVKLNNVTISNNSSYGGGGIWASFSEYSLTDVSIANNVAEQSGGGIFNTVSSPILKNTQIIDNMAISGGGIWCFYDSHFEMDNVTLSRNTAINSGGGIYIWASSNPTITDNTAENGGAMYNRYNSTPIITNSILWNNSDFEICGDPNERSELIITHTNIKGGEDGINDSLFNYTSC